MKQEKTTFTYVQNILAYNCMPTLLKLKPSTILNVPKREGEKAEEFFNTLGKEIKKFDCKYAYILNTATSHIILVYHEQMLKQQFEDTECNQMLASFGYQLGEQKIADALSCLKCRYRNYMEERKEFPDELGIFFGYPIEDVKAYIKNNGKNYKRCGYWKVYCNVERAEQTFRIFKGIREAAIQAVSAGVALTEVEERYLSA